MVMRSGNTARESKSPCYCLAMDSELERAEHHVTEGRRIVAEQRARVAELQAHGRDARVAESRGGLKDPASQAEVLN
jgi:hypothetical protein